MQQCRFPALLVQCFSEEYKVLREEYGVESVTFGHSVRKAVARVVKAAFARIGVKRLSGYITIEGAFSSTHPNR